MGCVVVVMEGVSQVGSPASKYLPEAQLDSTISIREPTETAHHLPPPFQVVFQVPTRTLARITYVCRPAVRWGLDSLIRPQVRKARQGQVEEGSLSLHGRGLGGIRPFLGVCGCAGVRWFCLGANLCEGAGGRGGGCDGTGCWFETDRGVGLGLVVGAEIPPTSIASLLIPRRGGSMARGCRMHGRAEGEGGDDSVAPHLVGCPPASNLGVFWRLPSSIWRK